MSDKIFRIRADAVFYASDIDDALEQLRDYFTYDEEGTCKNEQVFFHGYCQIAEVHDEMWKEKLTTTYKWEDV